MIKLTLAQRRGILIMIFCKELFETESPFWCGVEVKRMSGILKRGCYNKGEANVLNFYRFEYYELKEKNKK